jgi:hypothetical protein
LSQETIAHMIMEKRVFGLLQSQGHLFPDSSLIVREDYRTSYQWMARQMEDRLRPPLPGCPAWPMWARIRHDGFEVPPPIERSSDHIIASIRFHSSDILLSEVGSWEEIQMNFIVADRHQDIAALNAEHEAFFQKCAVAGCSIAENPYPEPLQREIELTWDRIFDVRPSDSIVQATFFSISAENVVEVRKWDGPTSRRRRIIEGQQPDAQFLSQTASSAC